MPSNTSVITSFLSFFALFSVSISVVGFLIPINGSCTKHSTGFEVFPAQIPPCCSLWTSVSITKRSRSCDTALLLPASEYQQHSMALLVEWYKCTSSPLHFLLTTSSLFYQSHALPQDGLELLIKNVNVKSRYSEFEI